MTETIIILTSIALGILFFISLWHFAYENMIAPTMLLDVKYDLYALRDELRIMQIKGPNEIYLVVHSGLNNTIQRMNEFTILRVLIHANQVKKYPEQIKRIEEFKSALSQHLALKEIFNNLTMSMARASAINCGAWSLYGIPVLFWLAFSKKIAREIQGVFIVNGKISSNLQLA